MADTRLFGDYSVIKQIGQGSLGAVFLAEHRFMKRHYVLKVLPEELSSDRAFVQRLEEEVAILSGLDHPNIVKIHNVSFANGQYFLVTDCIVDELGETTNLAQYVQGLGKRLDEEIVFRILWQIADALFYAHSKKASGKGIAHRGLKLNNVLVGKGRGGEINVHLSDFGLSRIVGVGAVLTRTFQSVAEALSIGAAIAAAKTSQRYPVPPIDAAKLSPLHLSFLQTYAFLAPEQKRLDSPSLVDGKVDVFALGVLAYYLLLGEFPEGQFEMPSMRLVDHMWNWDGLIRGSLQSDPVRRPENLLAVLDAVRQSSAQVAASVGKMPGFQMEEKLIEPRPLPVEPVILPAKEPVVQRIVNQEGSGATLQPIIRTAQLERPDNDMDPTALLHVDSTVKFYTPERKEVRNIQPLLTDMIIVRGGTFYRGSNDGNRDEVPRHQVTLNSFAIDIHPVTNEQFVRFLDALGGEKDNNHQDIIRLRDSRIKRSGGKLSIESGYAKHPVVGVTWYGAVAYAKWVGKRLPTEAEWEIAAYGGSEGALYQTGDDIEKTQANFFSSDTTPVMSYAPNRCGLYDMAGNVYEWCHDWYGYNYYEISIQEPENPKGPLQGVYRVLRGGCWKSLKEDLRCSRRHRNNPGTVNSTYGFRCATDVQ